MKILLALVFSISSAFASGPYTVIEEGSEVRINGVTQDLFQEYVLKDSNGPRSWKKSAENFIYSETNVIDEFGHSIELSDIADYCETTYDKIEDYQEVGDLVFKWKALKPSNNLNARTILYVVTVSDLYTVYLANGTQKDCAVGESEQVFLNKPSFNNKFTYLGERVY